MVRHLSQKLYNKNKSFRPAWRSPMRPAASVNSKVQEPSTSRYTKFRTFRNDDDDSRVFDHGYELARELDALGRDNKRVLRRCDSDESMDWDDESTLVAMLQDTTQEDEDEEQLVALANKLKAPMSAQGMALKQYFADTLLPVITTVRDAHEVLEDQVDLAFGTGVLAFDEVCKKYENMAMHDEDELKTACMESQHNIQCLLAKLEDAYTRRDRLWTTLAEDLDACAAGATAILDSLGPQLEQTMAQLDKKSKELDKESSAASKQKMLRGLIEKFA